jgi:hypothetical protein
VRIGDVLPPLALAQISEWTKLLPRSPDNVDILLVRKTGENGYSKDYRVRRRVVADWLAFKMANDPAYADVELDLAALAALPDDDTIGHLLPSVPADDLDAEMAEGVPGTGVRPPPASEESAQGEATATAGLEHLTPHDSGVFALDPNARECSVIAATLRRTRRGGTTDDSSKPREAVSCPAAVACALCNLLFRPCADPDQPD